MSLMKKYILCVWCVRVCVGFVQVKVETWKTKEEKGRNYI